MLGARIRAERLSQERSLADVAKKAKVSIATLSRIENEKQALELGMFLTLARVLGVNPSDLLSEEDHADSGINPLVRKIAGFEIAERTQLWRELAQARRQRRPGARRQEVRQLAQQVEELLAQIEFVRDELDGLRKRLKKK